MAQKLFVAEREGFNAGECRTTWHGNTDIAVFNIDGSFYAIEDACSHDGGALTGGKVEGGEVECPRHFARFSIKTGEVKAPPAFEDIEIFETVVEDGKVYVIF